MSAPAHTTANNESNTTLPLDEAPRATTDLEKAEVTAKPPMPTFPEGGTWGWAAVAGSWLVLMATFGYANAFGVYQSYYQFTGYPDRTASDISWIGSIQLFLQFSLGAVAGPLYDKGHFYPLVITGSVIYIVSVFMVALCKQFWQVMLAQAIGMGIGAGLVFLPALSILSQYFFRRRALAIGIAVTGSSVGGIIFPIMLNNLIVKQGFKKAVLATGYLNLGALVIAILLMRPRIKPHPSDAPKPTPRQLFQSGAYSALVFGLFFVAWGLFFPLFYLQVFAQEHGLSQNLVFYTLAILNAASVFGRISPNFLADYVGPINLFVVMCVGCGIMVFTIFGAGTPGGLIVIAILYGFFSGAYVSLMSPSLISLAKSHTEIGIRMGFGMLTMSLAALTGTPITGALLDKYGFKAPIVFSGISVLVGAGLIGLARMIQVKNKGTWKV